MQVISCLSEVDSFIKRVEDESHSKYVCVSVDRGFTKKDWQPLPKNRVYWQWSGGGGSPSIEFTGVPFMFVGGKRLGCHRGKDRAVAQKKKYAAEKAKKMMEDETIVSQTSLSQYTKKVGCPATICISKIAMFPKFRLGDNKERTRKKASKALKQALQRDPVVWETCFVLTHHNEHSGHERDEVIVVKKKRRKRLKNNETEATESPSQKRARKTRLRNKCFKLTKELLDKLCFIEDFDKLQETSGKLRSLLEDLAPFSNCENERPLQMETSARSLPLFTSTLTQRTIQRLKSKYTERVGAKVCRKSVNPVTVWPVHSVANTLEIE